MTSSNNLITQTDKHFKKGSKPLNLHGWIVYNGHLPGEKFLILAKYFQDAAKRKGLTASIIKNNDLLAYMTTDDNDLIQTNDHKRPDFVIFTDKDIYLAKQLELLGIRVFNSAKAIAISDDKIATYQELTKHNFPMPKTIIAPKIFFQPNELDQQYLTRISETLGFPLVIKEAFGSFGEQVYLVHNREEMIKKVNELHGRPYVFQEYISTSYGKDIRLHVVGDKVVASMFRQTEGDFRATAGGVRLAYDPTEKEADLAIRATKAIGADFAGVDLLFGPDDTRIVCEVNSNAHIGKLHNSTNINVADYVIDYIIAELTNK